MPTAVLIAHGQPSDPKPAAAELQALADQVQRYVPGLELLAATLAEPGAVADVTRGRLPGLVFPLFMADGWFTRVAVPRALEQAGAGGWQVLPAFGTLRQVQDLAVEISRSALAAGADQLLLAAHGSFKSSEPADLAYAMAARIQRETGASRVEAAFIEQAPRLADIRDFPPDTPCLPFFAMAGGHIRLDLPRELALAGFQGPILPPLGLAPEVPALIADVLDLAFDQISKDKDKGLGDARHDR